MPTILLETRGARSGRLRQAVLGFLEEPPDAWLIIALKGGAAGNPAWLHNLAHDRDATIQFADRRRVQIRAETLEGSELESAWRRIEVEAHQYSDYRTRTDREISVVRLRRRQDA